MVLGPKIRMPAVRACRTSSSSSRLPLGAGFGESGADKEHISDFFSLELRNQCENLRCRDGNHGKIHRTRDFLHRLECLPAGNRSAFGVDQ